MTEHELGDLEITFRPEIHDIAKSTVDPFGNIERPKKLRAGGATHDVLLDVVVKCGGTVT